MVRCSECKKPVAKMTQYMDWLALANFLEFLHLDEQITTATYEAMFDRLMTFKHYTEDDNA